MGFPEFLVLISALAVFLTLPVLFMRYRHQSLLHSERMAALEKGIGVPAWPVHSPRVYLLRGLIWTFSGVALLVCLLGLAVASHRPETAEGRMLRAHSLSLNAGIPLAEAQQVIDKDGTQQQGAPLSLALIALIPLGVGAAYLVYYRSTPPPGASTGPHV